MRKVYLSGDKKRLTDDRPDLENKVYIGSGHFANQMNGYLNIDIQPYEGCKCWDFTNGLPFIDDNSIDKFLSRISLEFMQRIKVIPLLNEVYGKLKPGGHFENLLQDLEAHCKALFTQFSNDHEYLLRKLYGRQLYVDGIPVAGTFRYNFFSYQTMAMLLSQTGYVKIQVKRLRTRMIVTGYKPTGIDEEEIFIDKDLPEDILDCTRKPRYHKGL